MFCPCCQLDKPRNYCAVCIQEGVTSHLQLAHNLRNQCSVVINKTDKSSAGTTAWRRLRSEIAQKERKCKGLEERIKAREQELESFRSRSYFKQGAVQDTRRFLHKLIADLDLRLVGISRRITHARKVLVKEAVGIFGIRQIDGVWTIADMPIPRPEGLKSLPSATINGALVHAVHLISLLTRYLSITLPFTPTFPKQPHTGRPLMKPNLPFINTTKYRDKVTLWMSSTATRIDSRSTHKYRQFLVAFGLLAHSTAYLAWSQGVEGIGVEEVASGTLVSATSVLQLLRMIVDSVTLGIRSHEPGTTLVNHLGFSLDVAKVVESSVQSGLGDDHSEGWDVIDASSV